MKRLIARLDIKNNTVIKGIHLEGLRVVGDPNELAMTYYQQGADELLYIDAVASLYNRNHLKDVVRYTAENIFIPLTIGGGIRSLADVEQLLENGADKIAINTQATKEPSIICEVAKRFGSQCMVVSIEAKKHDENSWHAYTDCGRETTDLDVIAWAKQAEDLGAGELLITSVDQEGTKTGYDVPLMRQITDAVQIPVVASGGMGKVSHLEDLFDNADADAAAIAASLHYNTFTINELKSQLAQHNIDIRI